MNRLNKWLCEELSGNKGYVNGWDIFVYGLFITLISVLFVCLTTALGYCLMNGLTDEYIVEMTFSFIHFIVGFISVTIIYLIVVILVKIFTHKFIVCPIVKKEEENYHEI